MKNLRTKIRMARLQDEVKMLRRELIGMRCKESSPVKLEKDNRPREAAKQCSAKCGSAKSTGRPKLVAGPCPTSRQATQKESERSSSCAASEIITRQAQRIAQQKDVLRRMKLHYEHQVASIKSSAQQLESHLSKLQIALLAEVGQRPGSFNICESYYKDILSAVDEMQSRGMNIYDSPVVSQQKAAPSPRADAGDSDLGGYLLSQFVHFMSSTGVKNGL